MATISHFYFAFHVQGSSFGYINWFHCSTEWFTSCTQEQIHHCQMICKFCFPQWTVGKYPPFCFFVFLQSVLLLCEKPLQAIQREWIKLNHEQLWTFLQTHLKDYIRRVINLWILQVLIIWYNSWNIIWENYSQVSLCNQKGFISYI